MQFSWMHWVHEVNVVKFMEFRDSCFQEEKISEKPREAHLKHLAGRRVLSQKWWVKPVSKSTEKLQTVNLFSSRSKKLKYSRPILVGRGWKIMISRSWLMIRWWSMHILYFWEELSDYSPRVIAQGCTCICTRWDLRLSLSSQHLVLLDGSQYLLVQNIKNIRASYQFFMWTYHCVWKWQVKSVFLYLLYSHE